MGYVSVVLCICLVQVPVVLLVAAARELGGWLWCLIAVLWAAVFPLLASEIVAGTVALMLRYLRDDAPRGAADALWMLVAVLMVVVAVLPTMGAMFAAPPYWSPGRGRAR